MKEHEFVITAGVYKVHCKTYQDVFQFLMKYSKDFKEITIEEREYGVTVYAWFVEK